MKKKILISNAKIWTSNKKMPWADCLVIDGDAIGYVGEKAGYSGSYDVVVDAKGKMITPSFIDSHLHISMTALSLNNLWFQQRPFKTFEELLEVLKAYADEHPKEEVPFINSYSCPSECIDAEGVDRYLVDQYVSDRPVYIMDVNFHRGVCNSKMLELMEIDKNTPYNPDSASNYERFEDGTPNGILLELVHEFNHDIDTMYKNLGWRPPREDDPELISKFMDRMTNYGISAIHEGYTDTDLILKALTELETQGRLKQYVQCMPLMNSMDELEPTIQKALDWKKKYTSEYITVNSVKIFLDGSLELGTYASLDPFVNEPDNYGILNFEEDELVRAFERFNQEGLDTQIHLVGDRAFRVALNAVERAQKSEAAAGRKFESKVCLMHCELTHLDDRKRPAELGVIVNSNPGWMGGIFGDGCLKYMSQEKFEGLYSFNEIIGSGATVCFSSDIVDEGGFAISNPFHGMEIAHRRIDETFVGTEQRSPAEECVSLEDLLYGFTINNAYEMGIDHKTGSLEEGKKANLCILSDNLFEVPENEIRQIKVDTLMFEGEIIKGEL